MTDKWVFNADETALINSNYILLITMEPPELGQNDYTVVAKTTYGTEILHRGTDTECLDYYLHFGV